MQAVTGGVFNLASGTISSGASLSFGNYHQGATPPTAQTISVMNNGPVGSYTENLDAAFGAPGTDITASGSFTGLAAGSTNNSSLSVGVTTGMAGTLAGAAVAVNFTSDGSGTSNLGMTPNGSQNVTISAGNVFSGKMAWNIPGSGNWSTDSSWTDTMSSATAGAPGLAGALSYADTATFGGMAHTLTLDVSPSLAGITFNTPTNTGYTITPSGGNGIMLSTGSSTPATVTVTSGSHTISAPVTVANGGVNVTGVGSVTLNGSANTFNGNISVGTGSDSPTLVINAGSSVNSNVAQGITATVAAGATLELAGSKSALVDNTNATNPMYRASVQNAGTLQIGDLSSVSTQQVGGIDPDGGTAGSVVVSDGSSLTADHINQTSLVIGNNSVFTLAPSASDGSPMAGQGSAVGSSLVLAGSLAPSSSFIASSGSLLSAGGVSAAALSPSLGAARQL